MSKIIIPYLNPVKLHELTRAATPKYLSKHMDYFAFKDTIKEWEQETSFCQIFQTTDSIRLQIESDYDEADLSIKLVDKYEREYLTPAFVQGPESDTEPGLFLYEMDLPLTTLPDGHYQLRLLCDTKEFVSEPLHIKDVHDNSIVIEYKHREYKDGVWFDTDFYPEIRLYGAIDYKTPASNDTLYIDQSYNSTLLDSVPFRVWELVLSDARGIPDYLIDKINRILGCSSIRIDGIYYNKETAGAKLEEKSLEDYSMRGWSIDMMESENKTSYEYNTAAVTPPVAGIKLATPVITATAVSSSQIDLVITAAIPNAASYNWLRAKGQNFIGQAVFIGNSTGLTFESTGLIADRRYYYFCQAIGLAPYTPSDYGMDDTTTLAATAPITLAAPVVTPVVISDTQINKTWPAILNATGYRGRINTTTDFGSSTEIFDDTLLLKNSTGLPPDTTHYFFWQTKGNGATYLDSAWAMTSAKTDPANPSTVFDTILTHEASRYDEEAHVSGYSAAINAVQEFHFNAAPTFTGTGQSMQLTIGGVAVYTCDFLTDQYAPGYDAFKYVHTTGVEYFGTFTNGTKVL